MPLDTDIRIVATSVISPLGENTADNWAALLACTSSVKTDSRYGESVAVIAKRNREGMLADSLAYGATLGVDSGFVENRKLFYCTTKGRADWWLVQKQLGEIREQGLWGDFAAAPHGYQFPASTAVSNACVSGAQAVIEGAEALEDHDCNDSVVVGSDRITEFIITGFRSLNAQSNEPARPFDASRDGLSLGEAGAAALLRRAPDLENPQRHPRIISYGCSNDANHISGPSRDGSGLALAIERALDGIDRSEIRAICAHGTATTYNDAMEARAFHTVFGGSPPPVFGIKGAIGHTLGAAGLIEVIVSALVATEGVIPPTVGFEQGEEDYPLDVVHSEPRKIEPGYVLTTNSGFGGMNTAIVIGPGRP